MNVQQKFGETLQHAEVSPRKQIVIVSQHWYSSRRKANFHFLADAFADLGHDVTFMTVQISPISWLRRSDVRACPDVWKESGKLIKKRSHLRSFVWLTPFHVFSLRSPTADRLTSAFFRLYGHLPLGKISRLVREADLFLFESTGGILMVDRFRRMNPSAAYLYRPSDNLSYLRAHPVIVSTEERLLKTFDFISAPSRQMYERAEPFGNVAFHPHGVDKEAFLRETQSPFPQDGRVHVVSVGASCFDHETLRLAAQAMPDWIFHIIGNVPQTELLSNIRYYGEIPFAETIPYLQHADIGLSPYCDWPEVRSLADSSLRLTQYTWCRLPSVAPTYCLRPDRPHLFGYEHSRPETIKEALLAAGSYDRNTIQRDQIESWGELAEKILNQAGRVKRVA